MSASVILVRTHSPGNLGSAARAAKAFGASLLLIDPRTDRQHPDARAFASGAEDVLDRAEVLAELRGARERSEVLIALTSLRGRDDQGLPPRLPWAAVRRRLRSGDRVGLVFGPERGGLTAAELRVTDAHAAIDTAPEFPTLNLAQAVAAALALAGPIAPRTGPATERAPGEEERASPRELTLAIEAIEDTTRRAGWLAPGHSSEVLLELAAVLRRAQITRRELSLLRGALAAVSRALGSAR